MSNLFGKNSSLQFLQLIQKPVRSREELMGSVRRAICLIAEDLHLGKMLLKFTVSQSKVRSQAENLTSVLYQSEQEIGCEPVIQSYRTGDGGTVLITLYALQGYTWSDDELQDIRIFMNQVYYAFRQASMENLLDKAMTTDLSVEIPNVSGFMSYASQILARNSVEEYVGLFFNVRNFKYVNKVLPYMQADEIMKIYAGTLMNYMESDEIVARLGGDNYVALVRKENTERFIRFINNINITYRYEDAEKKFSFGATIGAAELKNIMNAGDIMDRISIAYQMARQQQSSKVVYFREEFYHVVMRQKEVIASFQKALEQQEFVVYYQPKVGAADRKLYGAEALIRWKDGNNKLIQPMEFIPILEKDGKICKLDFYVLNRVCELLQKCKEQGNTMPHVSVNFSRKHIGNPDLVKEIVAVIDSYQVPHEYIEIELTESEDFRDYIVMAKLIGDLKNEGIRTSIDDFGTGFSSLNMLKMTSIDILKIDKSFIPLEEEYPDKKKDCIMFENIAKLAKELGYLVIAEGVETEKQYEYLRDVGCDIIQGFYFDKPMPEEKFLEKVVIGQYK